MIDRVDVFIFLDDVQYVDRGWQNRNRIRKAARSSEAKWLTVPVRKTSKKKKAKIKDIEICWDRNWIVQHRAALFETYRRAPYFDAYFELLCEWLQPRSEEERLSELNIRIIENLCQTFGRGAEIVRSSQLKVLGSKNARLIGICNCVGAEVYLANNGAMPYIVGKEFQEAGVGFTFQNYRHPWYDQGLGSFASHLSVLDAVFHVGPNTVDLIREGRPDEWEDKILWPKGNIN